VSTIGKPKVLRHYGVLTLVNLAAVAGVYWFDSVIAWSLLAGALLFILPHSYFTFYAFRFRGARAGGLIAQSFYRGETGKYVLTLVGFGCVFSSPIVMSLPWLCLSYLINWLVALIIAARAVRNVKL